MTYPTIEVYALRHHTVHLSPPWYLLEGEYPVLSQNKIQLLICGKNAMGEVEKEILGATKSIDIISWGFDPALSCSGRGGRRIGDILIEKAKAGVKVRILIWMSFLGNWHDNNIPGKGWETAKNKKAAGTKEDAIFRKDWFDQIKDIDNIMFRTRDMMKLSEGNGLPETTLFSFIPTHHQKVILIDYEEAHRSKSCGFVMGHNLLMEYWDNTDHLDEDEQRFENCGPWQDLSTKVHGPILYNLNQNFTQAWDNGHKEWVDVSINILRWAFFFIPIGGPIFWSLVYEKFIGNENKTIRTKFSDNDENLTEARASIDKSSFVDVYYDKTARFLRTQPQYEVTDIYKAYKLAISNAYVYIYIENQYFRHAELAQHLVQTQADLKQGGRGGTLNVFVVTNPPQTTFEAPSTYNMLKVLGQGNSMPEFVKHDDKFAIEDAEAKEALKTAHINVNIATLKTPTGKDIYVHSKLLLVDDSFFLLGSANINKRSMKIDSESAVCTADYNLASSTRKILWKMHSGNDGGEDMDKAFKDWGKQMQDNLDKSRDLQILNFHLTQFYYGDYGTIRID